MVSRKTQVPRENKGKGGAGSRRKPEMQSNAVGCDVFHQCGACEFLRVSYSKQLAEKQQRIEELFKPMAPHAEIRTILGMDVPYHYRNKVVSPFAPSRKKKSFDVKYGMYAKGTHALVPTASCVIENEIGKRVIGAVRSLMLKWKIPPYDEDEGTGFLRNAVVRVGHATEEVLVTLVTNSSDFPSSKSFCRQLVARVSEITTVVQNINTRQTNVILGDTERTLYGPGFILDRICGLSFRISSQSFYQINPAQAEVLYTKAIDMAALADSDTVVDAYCGTGTIGLVAASRGAGHVIGVDSVDSSIRDARMNAKHNGIDNAEFVCADATEYLCDMASGAGNGEDVSGSVLLMDPPRAGSTPEFLKAAANVGFKRIVYISCEPKTQARDVELLSDSGYSVTQIQPVDMFPHTKHIENIVVLEKRP